MFGIDVFDASLGPALAVAVLAGVLSFLSPCVLPIVPPYLAFMAGASVGDGRNGRVLQAAVFFVLGLSTVFLLLGLAASALGPALAVAVLAGVLSFLSPCVLPIVPPYLAFMAGASVGDGRNGRVLQAAVFFVLGLSTVFLLLGLAASALGRVLLERQEEMAFVAGVVILIFGLNFLGLLRLPFLAREWRLEAKGAVGSPFGAYVLGLAFAFGWTPCIGPVLGAILSLAAQSGSAERGLVLMGGYAAGLGLPFLLTAVFLGRAMRLMAGIKRHMALVERVMGVLLCAVGVMMLTGSFRGLSFWLLETFPGLATIG